jgi:FtsH-binding integral membrane protein
MCFARISRRVPINYFIMLILTLCESYMLSLTCARYNPKDVFQIFLLTAASFTAMSVYAVFTKKDLTIFGSIISGASICMLTISLLMFFTSTPLLRMVYSGLGVILALLFVAVDTQMIL